MRGHSNEFLYDDIEPILRNLLAKYGLKNTSAFRTQYPFVYLSSSPEIWSCSIQKNELKHPAAASRSEVMGSIGKLNPEFFNFLNEPKNAIGIILLILNEYWPEAYHSEILMDLGIYETQQELMVQPTKMERSRRFVEEVLDGYERKCAICNQSIRLEDALIGIDACHVKPLQHFGDDHVTNGIALCKIHHWALDRGAISISQEMSLLVSKKLNGNKLFEYFTSFENMPIFIPRSANYKLAEQNISYHYKYIFVK